MVVKICMVQYDDGGRTCGGRISSDSCGGYGVAVVVVFIVVTDVVVKLWYCGITSVRAGTINVA